MKKIIALALVLVMFAGCGGNAEPADSSKAPSPSKAPASSTQSTVSQIYPATNNYEQITYRVADIADRLTLGNRCPILESAKGIVFDQAGANFSFKADCEGEVAISINCSVGWDYRFRHYTVYIDGVRQERLQVEANVVKGSTTFVIAKDLPRGVHEFKIYRSNPAEKGAETITSITLNGVPCEDKPAQKELLIEFLGDSLTAGLGNLDFEQGRFDSQYSDSTQTYAFFTAEAFGADFSSVCCGGLPFTADMGGMSITERYGRISFKRDLGEHDFARPADVVVINLGTNDHSRAASELSAEEYIGLAKNLVNFVKQKNPNAKIVWAYGMATSPSQGMLKKAMDELGGEEAGYYFCLLPGNIAGEGGHPVVASHQNAANVLIKFMKEKLGLKEVSQ